MSDGTATVGVVGGGFMGTGIAESVARAGMEVVVAEPEAERAAAARERIEASLDRAVRAASSTLPSSATACSACTSSTCCSCRT